MQEENENIGYAKNVQFGRKNFSLRPVVYIIVDFKKLVSNLLHANFVLVEAYLSRE